MSNLAYLTAMALLGIGLTLAQNPKPSSDPSNSSNPSAQGQSGNPASTDSAQNPATAPDRHTGKRRGAHTGVPDTTIRDHQGSTSSTTGVGAQNETTTPSTSTMGTTGSTPGTPDQGQQGTAAPSATPTDQQPNSTSNPSTSPRAMIESTPARRAAATHTPDPGTCMNPASLPAGGDGQVQSGPGCK